MPENERKCSLCQNHMPKSEAPPSKAHNNCFYKNDVHIKSCVKCQNVVDRRSHVAKEKKICYVPKKDSGNAKLSLLQPGTRACRNCHNHGKYIAVRNGHRNICPMRTCECDKCAPTKQRRIASTKFTKQFREQKLGMSKFKKLEKTNQQSEEYSGTDNDSDIKSEASSDHQSDVSACSLSSSEEDVYYPYDVLDCSREEIDQPWENENISYIFPTDDDFSMALEYVREDSFMEHQICVTSIMPINF